MSHARPFPPSPTVCPVCLGCQRNFDPTAQKLDPECVVCHGQGWVDPSLVCKCGRAGTIWNQDEAIWFCGHKTCLGIKPATNFCGTYEACRDGDWQSWF